MLVTDITNAIAEIEEFGDDAFSLAESVATTFAETVAESFTEVASSLFSSKRKGFKMCLRGSIFPFKAADAVAKDLIEVRPLLWKLTIGCIELLTRSSLQPQTISHSQTRVRR